MAERTLRVSIVGDAGSLKRALGEASGATSSFGRTLRRTGAVIGAGLGAGLAIAVKQSVEFERSMRNVNSIARLGERDLDALTKSVQRIAPAAGQSPQVLARGLYDIVSSGFKAKDAVKVLAVSAKAATAGLSDTATASRAVTAALNAYHLGAGKAREVSDVLFQTVNRGVLTFEELAQNMGDLVPAAAPLGISLEEVGAAMATITKQGVPAAEASTRVKNTMLALSKPSQNLTKLFREHGYESAHAGVKALGYTGVLGLLQKATGGNVAELQKLFPEQRAALGMVALLGKNTKTYIADLAAMKQATKGAGMTQAAFAEQSKSVGVQWDKARAALSVFSIQVGNVLLPALNGALQWMNVHWPQISAVVSATARGITVGLESTATAVRATVNFIRANWPKVQAVFSTVSGAVSKIMETLGPILGKWAKVWKDTFVIIGHLLRGDWRKALEAGKPLIRDFGKFVQAALSGIVDALGAIVPALLGVASGMWQKLLRAMGLDNMANTVGRIFDSLAQVFKGFTQIVKGILHGDFGLIWKGVKNIFAGAFKLIIFELQLMLQGIGNLVTKGGVLLGKGFAALGKLMLDSLMLGLGMLSGLIVRELRKVAGHIAGAAGRAAKAAGAFGAAIFSGITRGLGDLGSAVNGALKAALGAIKGLGGKVGGVLGFTVKVFGIQAAIRALTGFASVAGSTIADVAVTVASKASEIAQSIIGAFGRAAGWVREHWREIGAILGGPAAILATDAFGIRSALERLGPQVDALASKIGSTIVSGITGGLSGAAGAVTGAMGSVVGAVSGAVGRVSSAATAIGRGIVDGIRGGVAGVVGWLSTQMGALVGAVAGAISAAMSAAARFGAGVLSGVKTGAADLVAWLTGRIRETVAAVAGAIGAATSAAARLGGGVLGGVKGGVADLVGWVSGRVGEAVGAVRAAVGTASAAALRVGVAIVDGIVGGMTDLVQKVKGSLDRLWGIISNVAGLAVGAAAAIGSAIVSGIISGLSGLVGRVSGAIVGGVKGAISGSIGRLTGSPEVVAAIPIGHGIMAAVVRGVHDRESTVSRAIADSTKRAVAGAAQGNLGHWLGVDLVRALTKALTDGAGQVANAAGSVMSSAKSGALKGLNEVGQAIVAAAKKYGIDARAALAVAMGEGGVKFGAVGDQGTSFGPFQLHIGGASPYGDPRKAAAFANSIEGVNYALRKMKEAGASGLTGAAAINAIIRLFERPADPDSSIRNAIARYASIPATIGDAVGKASGAVETVGPAMVEATKRQIAAIAAAVKAVAPTIGLEKARGIVRGFLQESPSMAQQIKEALRQAAAQAMQAATEKVREARGALGSAFSELASAALAAFDSQVAKWQSPARKILEKMRLEETARQIAEAVRKAQEGLGAAELGVREAEATQDPEKIRAAGQAVLAAQEELRRAERAAQEFHLEQRAQREEAAHTKLMERRRVQFQNRLGALQAELTQEQAALAKAQVSGDPAAIAKARANIAETQAQIRAEFKKFIPEYELSGQQLGHAIAQGIRQALAAVQKAADLLAVAIRKRLKLKSNAEEGELADVETWWSGLVPSLVAGAGGSLAAIRGLGGSIASELRGGLETAIPGAVGAFKTSFSGLEEAVRPAAASLSTFAEPAEALKDAASGVASSMSLMGQSAQSIPLSLGLATEPVQNFATAAEKTAEGVRSATARVGALPPALLDLANMIGVLEPTLRNKLLAPIALTKGAAAGARDQIDGMREALMKLDGTSARTSVSNYITNYVKTIHVGSGDTSGPGPGQGPGGGAPPPVGGGRPYDRGGWLMPGLTMAQNNTGKPELVSPVASLKDALGAMVAPLATPTPTGRGIGGAGGLTINVNVTAEGSILAQHDLERKVHDAVMSVAKRGPLLSRTPGASL